MKYRYVTNIKSLLSGGAMEMDSPDMGEFFIVEANFVFCDRI